MAQVFISLGSNIQRERHISQGLRCIASAFNLPLTSLQLSSLFESEAVGFKSEPFYNMVVGLQCQHSVDDVVQLLRQIEIDNGRCPNAIKYSPRTLDLDLLLYNDLIINTPAQLPRDEIYTSAFVLWPLSEIAPELLHPVCKKSYQSLWHQFDKKSQALKIVANCWQ